MNTFRSIDELVKMFEREKVLLKEMFYKRKQLSFRYDYALELTEYKEERIRFLIEYGVLRESGDFLERLVLEVFRRGSANKRGNQCVVRARLSESFE